MSNQELEQVQEELSTNVKDLVTMADICQVDCINTAKQAVELVGAIKKTAKTIEDKRDSLVRPANDYVKSINATFKEISFPLDNAKRNVDTKIINFQKEQARIEAERKKIEAEKAAEEMRLEAEKLREQNKERQADLAVKAAEAIEKVEVKEEVKSFKSEGMATFKVRKIKRFKVANFQMLMDRRPDLVIANEKLIGELVRSGETQIAGVEIWEEEIAG
jgi:hypothetical protein